ncbi:MAG: hypothetical protein MJB57_06255, partial [Gemmatimonadetes bacterium]|nr:hypothetical protein [Gemmatimonadota bacterium]
MDGVPTRDDGCLDRRQLVKLGAIGAGGALLTGCRGAGGAEERLDGRSTRPSAPTEPFAAEPLESVRIGFVGIGGMGSVHVRNLLE